MRKEAFKGYCVRLGFTVWCVHSKHWECARSHAHPYASDKGKPAVRRRRKA
jgi:hypothetical protein